MQRIIDFHSHILPNADHGCSDVREALRQLRLAKKFGTTDIVATPHFEPENDTVSSFPFRRLLRSRAPGSWPSPQGTDTFRAAPSRNIV